jgi:1,4-dihydroxy-2-naphthoyl-CoA hydrolase
MESKRNQAMNIQDHINSSRRSGTIDFAIEERHEEYVVSSMPVTEGIRNPFGTVQAGALVWLADVTASVLAIGKRKIGPGGEGFPLAVDLHTTLLGNQRDGTIRAEARFVRKGQKILVIRTRLTGNGDRVLAEVTSTHVLAV